VWYDWGVDVFDDPLTICLRVIDMKALVHEIPPDHMSNKEKFVAGWGVSLFDDLVASVRSIQRQ
jgi:hypothetical protein